MQVVFRVDSATHIGHGHFMRCLTLADGLLAAGCQCRFVCRDFPGSIHGKAVEHGHQVTTLSSPAAELKQPLPYLQWLGVSPAQDVQDTLQALDGLTVNCVVVDSYSLDAQWHNTIRAGLDNPSLQLLVIDDLANRHYACDWLLDQTLNRPRSDYEPFSPTKSNRDIVRIYPTKLPIGGRSGRATLPSWDATSRWEQP